MTRLTGFGEREFTLPFQEARQKESDFKSGSATIKFWAPLGPLKTPHDPKNTQTSSAYATGLIWMNDALLFLAADQVEHRALRILALNNPAATRHLHRAVHHFAAACFNT